LTAEIRRLGRKALPVQLDVRDFEGSKNLIDSIKKEFGRLDILVNNAGVTRDNLMMRMSEEDWDMVLNVNLKGPFLLTRAISKIMIRQRHGRIINMSSVVGITGNAGQVNYSSSKGGLIAFTRSVAKELASRHITCNAIAPGFIKTAMTEHLTEEIKANFMKTIPLGRMGNAEDVANAALFFASDESGYITGQVLSVDGGMFMG